MLTSLDTIGWSGLTHAYGSADDVPDQIRALRSPDPGIRDKAVHSLYGNIFHQGTRFEASAHAVPFLLELLADPGTPDRASVLGLVTSLAIGYGEGLLPSGYPLADHRAAAEGGEALLAASRAYAEEDDEEDDEEEEEEGEDEPALFAFLQTLDPDDEGRLFAYFALQTYDAVAEGLPLFRDLLADGDPRVRTAAAYALSWYPEGQTDSLSPLLTASADEDPAVAATALVAIGLLGVTPQEGVLESALDDPRDEVRWGSAVAQARLLGQAADGRVADELLSWIGRDDATYEAVPYYDGDLRAYAAQAMRRLGDAHAGALFEALLARLPAVAGIQALPLVDAALEIAFPRPLPEGAPYGSLDERQRRLVGVLATSDGVWELLNVTEFVRHHGLPASQRDMAAYAAT